MCHIIVQYCSAVMSKMLVRWQRRHCFFPSFNTADVLLFGDTGVDRINRVRAMTLIPIMSRDQNPELVEGFSNTLGSWVLVNPS
jgi:hypothetical protein